MMRALDPCLTVTSNRPLSVAVLGVTPELIGLSWPPQSVVYAYDQSAEMIQSIWPAPPTSKAVITQSRWQTLPVKREFFDAVVGDGSLNALPHLDDYEEVFEELYRTTRPSAKIVLRCFARPEHPESISDLIQVTRKGQIKSFHAFKWHLAMSLAADTHGSVTLSEIYSTFTANFNREELTKCSHWAPDIIATIDAYRSSPTRYTFPTRSEWQKLSQGHWRINSIQTGTYELADRCPTLSFEKIKK